METREIPGFPGYWAAEDGSIFSAWSAKGAPKGSRINTGGPTRQLSPSPTHGGYLHLTLCNDGIRKNMKVHVLVLLAFCGERPRASDEGRHLNGNNTDNRAINLEWGTKVANTADRGAHGTTARGEAHGMAKLTAADVAAIRSTPKYNGFQRDMMRRYGLSAQSVQRIYNGQSWQEVDPPVGISVAVDARRKLTDDDIAAIRAAPRGYGLTKALAEQYGVTVTRICQLRK